MTRKCGACSFGKYIDSNHVECHGNPPQVILLPGPPDLAGQPRMMAQKLRPQMDNGEQGCSLWEDKSGNQQMGADPLGQKLALAGHQSFRGGGVVLR